MSISRKNARKRIDSKMDAVPAHLGTLRHSEDANLRVFWRRESQGMLREIRELARFVGKRTRNEVLSHVDVLEKEAGESGLDPE